MIKVEKVLLLEGWLYVFLKTENKSEYMSFSGHSVEEANTLYKKYKEEIQIASATANKRKEAEMDIEKAFYFAKAKHRGQQDDCGHDYFHAHIQQVVDILYQVTEDSDTICAAYLHDTIEDTATTYEELVKEFGERIANLVMELTHEGAKDERGFYFPRLQSKEAILIKFADRLSNLSRMESWDAKRQRHYLNKSKFWKSE